MEIRFENKVAFITGAAGGIGLAFNVVGIQSFRILTF